MTADAPDTAGVVLSATDVITHCMLTGASEVGAVIVPIFQMGKLNSRETDLSEVTQPISGTANSCNCALSSRLWKRLPEGDHTLRTAECSQRGEPHQCLGQGGHTLQNIPQSSQTVEQNAHKLHTVPPCFLLTLYMTIY